MAEQITSYSVDNDRRFRDALEDAQRQVKDLRVPLTLISKDWFQSNNAIFNLTGPGGYPPASPSTIAKRNRKGQPVYPLLVSTGRLRDSMTNPAHPDSVNVIVNQRSLFLGTKVSYGIFHQSDKPRRKIPLRKFVFIGPEASRFARGAQVGRLERWQNILAANVAKQLEKLGQVKP